MFLLPKFHNCLVSHRLCSFICCQIKRCADVCVCPRALLFYLYTVCWYILITLISCIQCIYIYIYTDYGICAPYRTTRTHTHRETGTLYSEADYTAYFLYNQIDRINPLWFLFFDHNCYFYFILFFFIFFGMVFIISVYLLLWSCVFSHLILISMMECTSMMAVCACAYLILK